MYTMSILYSGYTWSIPWVYSGYAIGNSLGNILGISWVYSGYTVDIPWLYYVLLPLRMYSVPAM